MAGSNSCSASTVSTSRTTRTNRSGVPTSSDLAAHREVPGLLDHLDAAVASVGERPGELARGRGAARGDERRARRRARRAAGAGRAAAGRGPPATRTVPVARPQQRGRRRGGGAERRRAAEVRLHGLGREHGGGELGRDQFEAGDQLLGVALGRDTTATAGVRSAASAARARARAAGHTPPTARGPRVGGSLRRTRSSAAARTSGRFARDHLRRPGGRAGSEILPRRGLPPVESLAPPERRARAQARDLPHHRVGDGLDVLRRCCRARARSAGSALASSLLRPIARSTCEGFGSAEVHAEPEATATSLHADEQRRAVHPGEREVERVGQALRRVAVDGDALEARADRLLQPVAQRRQARALGAASSRGRSRGRARSRRSRGR